MRTLLMPILLLPLATLAAVPVEGDALGETHLPSSPGCATKDKDRKPEACPADVTTQAVKEAEDQAAGRDAVTGPITAPVHEAPRPPADPALTPQQRDIVDQIKSLPDQIAR